MPENVNVGGSLHRTLNRLESMSAGNGSRRVRAVIQIDSSIHLVKGALPRYESVIYNWLPECVRTCRCLFQHHRYPLLSPFFHPLGERRYTVLRQLRAKPIRRVYTYCHLCDPRLGDRSGRSAARLRGCLSEMSDNGSIARRSSILSVILFHRGREIYRTLAVAEYAE